MKVLKELGEIFFTKDLPKLYFLKQKSAPEGALYNCIANNN